MIFDRARAAAAIILTKDINASRPSPSTHVRFPYYCTYESQAHPLPTGKDDPRSQAIAELRNTTVSALFQASLEQWRTRGGESESACEEGEGGMSDLLGVFRPQAPFDAWSARIREKHG